MVMIIFEKPEAYLEERTWVKEGSPPTRMRKELVLKWWAEKSTVVGPGFELRLYARGSVVVPVDREPMWLLAGGRLRGRGAL
jgi:hypothetical protein